jgi:hypothetical protein
MLRPGYGKGEKVARPFLTPVKQQLLKKDQL